MSHLQIENLVSNEADYEWHYIPGQEGREDVLRWKILVGGKDSARKGITFGVFEVPTGHTLDPHHHEPAEAYYVLEGEGELFLDDKMQKLDPGSVVFVRGNDIHGIRNNSGKVLKLVWIFPSDTYDEIQYHMEEMDFPLSTD